MNAGDKIPYWIDGALVEHTVTEEEARLWQAAQGQQTAPTLEDRISGLERFVDAMGEAYRRGVEEA